MLEERRKRLDVQRVSGASEWGRGLLVHLAAGLMCIPLVAPPVGVEGTEDPAIQEDLPDTPETAPGPFLLHEEHQVLLVLVAPSMVTIRSHTRPGTYGWQLPSLWIIMHRRGDRSSAPGV